METGNVKTPVVRLVCDKNTCNGCYACEAVCSQGAVSVVDNIRHFYARIDIDKCIDCGRCVAVCPNHRQPDVIPPVAWYQGWAEAQIRATSSSGGFAYKLSEAFIRSGGYVVTCVLEQGEFVFKVCSSVEDLSRTQGSKYVKSNPQKAYAQVGELLRRGEKVLYIALPCQVAAMKAYIGKTKGRNLYTADLICHGSPSPKVLEAFLHEEGIDPHKMAAISFRSKTSFGIAVDGRKLENCIPDKYTTAFMEGLCYTENCYSCVFAQRQRGADVTLGDAWGSALKEEQTKGISLLLCMTEKGEQLAGMIRHMLLPVDLESAVRSNRQLNRPSEKPKAYGKFFDWLEKGRRFSYAVFVCRPKVCIKQTVKKMLIKLGVLFHTDSKP